ncbi:hypothetical protein [Salinibacterium sp. ZJ77]|uniref:hypothetical protein n=1 Tax=Salinibacterium sp. ZJ77 TaxID=2708337 RepID=UPI00141F2627|nr:hypothetical protein [Salinibacterium sp. ZJ77]
MTDLPDTVTAGDTAFIRAESPADFAHWTSTDSVRPVSLIIEPAGAPSDETLAIAADVVANFDEVADTARAFIREQLGGASAGVSADDATRLADDAQFAAPEAVIWSDGTWMLRFADCGLDAASEYGIGVAFVGSAPQSVDLFDDAEDIDAEVFDDAHDHDGDDH